MKARPILFSTPMVQALLEGRKTQTRRIVKHPRGSFVYCENNRVVKSHELDDLIADPNIAQNFCPFGGIGDLLYVRETFAYDNIMDTPTSDFPAIQYAAGGFVLFRDRPPHKTTTWKPSIHMPRWASRLTLEITDIRVEKLQYISDEEATAEGCEPTETFAMSAADNFELLWKTINSIKSWDENPWVWVVEFKVHHCNVDDFIGGSYANVS